MICSAICIIDGSNAVAAFIRWTFKAIASEFDYIHGNREYANHRYEQ